MKSKSKSWRDVLPVHPAAELFPLMAEAELRELGESIKAGGLSSRIVLWSPACGSKGVCLIDGRNRLDAMELVGLDTSKVILPKEAGATHADPYAFVIAANIHRRHLTAEQKRDLIRKVIEAQPNKSNREIARQVKASPTVVGQERAQLSKRGQLPDKTIGKDGKARPAKRSTKQQAKRKPAAQEVFNSPQEAHDKATVIALNNKVLAAEKEREEFDVATVGYFAVERLTDVAVTMRDKIIKGGEKIDRTTPDSWRELLELIDNCASALSEFRAAVMSRLQPEALGADDLNIPPELRRVSV
jgi:hypothetical protein